MSQLSIVKGMSSNFHDLTDKCLESGQKLELFTDDYCRCSMGRQYAITPFICNKCMKWRPAFNYYMNNFKREVTMMGKLVVTYRDVCDNPYRTISGEYDSLSCEILCSHIVRKLIPGYPNIRDSWICSKSGFIIRDECVGIDEALKNNTPEDISERLLKDLSKLEERGYKPSNYSYNSDMEDPRSIGDLLSFNPNTMTPCLPISAEMTYTNKDGKYTISCDALANELTIRDLRKYIINMSFVRK